MADEPVVPAPTVPDEPNSLSETRALATDRHVTDLSERHSWYAHGGPEAGSGT